MLSNPNCILDSADAALFRHTGYLQQADIRELVTANSRQLGEIIRTLAVDDAVYMLDEALSQANITRTNRNYAAVLRTLDGVASEAQELCASLEAINSTIHTVESSDQQIQVWAVTIATVADQLGISRSHKIDTFDAVYSEIETLNSILQDRLADSDNIRRVAERQLHRGSELKKTESVVANSDSLLREVQSQLSSHEKTMQDAEVRITELQQQLKQPEFTAGITDRTGNLIRALEQINSFPDLNVCPVCDREFKDLNSHIGSKLDTLHSEQSLLQQRLGALRADLEARLGERGRLARVIEELRTRSNRLGADRERYIDELADLSREYTDNKDDKLSLSEIERRASERRDRAAREEQKLASLIGQVDEIRSSISAVTIRKRELNTRLSTVSTRLALTEKRLRNARSAQERVEQFIDTAQEVRRRVSSAIQDVIAGFVMGHTKGAFEELFRRLAKNPFFDVTISGARVKWHAPEVSWTATYNNRHFPGNAVFSQGELNSCAIAFFLALATSHPGGLKFLMLDDPVQNMDEIHIEEFGNILKFLKDELGWQLIIGLHDESVFQFFKRQLHPSRRNQSLAAYVFEEMDAGSRIVKEMTVSFDPATFIAQVA